ncbi:CLUMA_CG010409, isoform A [Clunio marinus]|uniref:CLUMA_CG010409, isoform A n=1 Tax=Clunio marinus TaxID=568069 RepID=A0A1J1IB80_9DIPT|nr:CLUMA_CG010409, isoform A [Clunio marinus]
MRIKLSGQRHLQFVGKKKKRNDSRKRSSLTPKFPFGALDLGNLLLKSMIKHSRMNGIEGMDALSCRIKGATLSMSLLRAYG